MENKQIVRFDMYEMEHKGGVVESDLILIPFEERYYEQYKKLIDDCFFEMRKALNIQPYEKHSNSLDELTKLSENTFLLLNGDEVILAGRSASLHCSPMQPFHVCCKGNSC